MRKLFAIPVLVAALALTGVAFAGEGKKSCGAGECQKKEGVARKEAKKDGEKKDGEKTAEAAAKKSES